MVTVCRGRRLPGDSSDRYPRARRAALSTDGTPSYLVLLREGFAWPAGHAAAGGLLPHRFTLALRTSLETGPLGGLISVALSFGSPRLGVTQRPALRSPDFPPTLFTSPAVPRPPPPPRNSTPGCAPSCVVTCLRRTHPLRPGTCPGSS